MKKGFTLIELLAVIVVLAILSLIVIPVISKTINDSQINIDKRSLESYVRAIETSYYNEKANNPSITPEQYVDEYLSNVEYKGSKIECSSIEFVGEKIEDIELYDCKVGDRGNYSYIEYKADKVDGKSILTITYKLSDVTSSNKTDKVIKNKSYNTKLSVTEDLVIRNIIIKMDGKDITNEAYNNGEISIEKVTGDIEIIASSSQAFTIITNLTNVTIDNDITEIYSGESYKAILTVAEGYVLKSTIKMNNEDITEKVLSNGVINIDRVIGNLEIILKGVTQFEYDSWETIASNVKKGNIKSYKIGDTKEVDLGQLGKNHVRISNMSTPEECSTEDFSQTACGFVLEFVDIITTHKMNSSISNVGGWPASELYTYLTETIYDSFPEDLKNVIMNTKVVSGYENGKTDNYITVDKLYLLSTKEVWGTAKSYDKVTTQTRQLDYYESINASNYSQVIKEYNSTEKSWWLRSAWSSNVQGFGCVINQSDASFFRSFHSHGVSPAFRIG